MWLCLEGLWAAGGSGAGLETSLESSARGKDQSLGRSGESGWRCPGLGLSECILEEAVMFPCDRRSCSNRT